MRLRAVLRAFFNGFVCNVLKIKNIFARKILKINIFTRDPTNKAPHDCPLSTDCPVLDELQKQERDKK